MVFAGPPGCGKSTLMRMIAGRAGIDSGQLLIDDVYANDLPPARRGVAMVFHDFALYPHMTVAENIGFGLRITDASRQEIDEIAGLAAARLRITHLLGKYPKTLDGGERLRVATAAACVGNPRLLIFDEPQVDGDAELRTQMCVELRALHRELGLTMIYVTRQQSEAMAVGDRIAVFQHGVVEQLGTPADLYRAPVNTFVAQYLGWPRINLLPVTWRKRNNLCQIEVGHQALAWNGAGKGPAEALRDDLLLGLRPEHLDVQKGRAEADNEALGACLEEVTTLSDSVLLRVRVAGLATPLIISLPPDARTWVPGQVMTVRPRAGAALLFAKAGPRVA